MSICLTSMHSGKMYLRHIFCFGQFPRMRVITRSSLTQADLDREDDNILANFIVFFQSTLTFIFSGLLFFFFFFEMTFLLPPL